ncbi:MFS transporter [Streptomyces kunmingensis]|uniref:MFS transporter n=1 Tax=Streptomyces kunmingensis TaxID=68225 RepID=A0ABU6CCW3_9ACTN|nr:MFS transporter [Streptomyces kunmingensis]MEB3962560.1 MFS transporter [Streptomyces kunmingensis]
MNSTKWVVAAGAALAIVVAGAFSTLAGLLVGPLHEELGWSRSAVGLGSLVNMVVYGATAPFAAALMDRVGMRKVAVGALGLVGGGALLATTMTAPWQFILYWGVLVGLGTGATATTFAATVTERWFVARRGLVAGLLTAASVVGQFVFLPLLSWVIDAWGWRAAAYGLVFAVAGALPLVYAAVRDPEPRAAPVALHSLRNVNFLRSGPFWLLAGTFAVCGASTNGVMWTHFAPAAHDHGMPTTVAASLLSLIGIFNIAGTVGSGWATDRLDPRRLLAAYYALRGLSLLALPLLLSATVDPPLVAFTVAFGLLDVATVPPTIALCRAHYGTGAPVVFGWVSAAHQVGAGSVAYVGGAVRDVFGSYDLVWVGAGVLCAVAALLSLVIDRGSIDRGRIDHGSTRPATAQVIDRV